MWGGVQVAVQEVRRLQKYGVTAGELTNYKAALMRDSEHLAEQWQSVPSADTLDYCMECLALNHTFMAQEEVCCCAMCNEFVQKLGFHVSVAWLSNTQQVMSDLAGSLPACQLTLVV